MIRQHVEAVARELLEAGWLPTSECCLVVLIEGAPRLVDCEVWNAMRSIREAAAAFEADIANYPAPSADEP
jgi:hypothetical protein